MRRVLTIAAVVATQLAMSPALATAHNHLTPAGGSTQFDIVRPFAGSPQTLVFSRQRTLARSANDSETSNASPRTDVLYARSSSGKLTTLGVVPTDYWQPSVNGSVVAIGIADNDDLPSAHVADVWSLPTGKRHVITLAPTDRYLAAAPNGIVFTTASGVVKIRTLTGTTTTLATPFGTGHTIVFGGASSTSVVVSDTTGKVADIDFASPHTVTQLQNPSGELLKCDAVSSHYTACAIGNGDDDGYEFGDAQLVPLNGGAVTVTTTSVHCDDLGAATLAGQSLAWTCVPDATNASQVRVYTQASGVEQPTKLTGNSGYDLVSAYGAGVVESNDDHSLLKTAGTKLTTFVARHRTAVTVDSFALAGNRLVYADDQRVTATPSAQESVYTRSLTTAGSHVDVGEANLLTPGTTNVTGNLVGASASLVVYATTDNHRHELRQADLHVISATGEATVKGAITQGVIQVSGSRVLYQASGSGGSTTEKVYNAKTKRSSVALTIRGGLNYTAVALSGHYLAYATRHGAIDRKDLLTGHTVQLAAALPNDPGGVEFDVYAHGPWVGWHATALHGELAKDLNKIRNASTMAPAISLHHTLYSLSFAGALLDTGATFRAEFSEAGVIDNPTAFWLRSYGGTTTSLLSKRWYVSGPQISGHVLAWAGPSGALESKVIG